MTTTRVAFCLLALFAEPVFGDGQIIFANRNLSTPTGEVYHVPIWLDLNGNGTFDVGEGIGSYASAAGERATLALYVKDNPIALAQAFFRFDDNGQFLGFPASQAVSVPGFAAGETSPLVIRAWVGDDFATAAVRGQWEFISPPLGGTPLEGVPIPPPMIDNWGSRDGRGFELIAPPPPIARDDVVTRRSFFEARFSIADLLANDSDPAGGAVSFGRVDSFSNNGAELTAVNGEIIYERVDSAGDYFFYSMRNSAGGIARARVNVIVNDPDAMILFGNSNIATSTGNAVYNVPIFVDADGNGFANVDEPFGYFASLYYQKTAHLGLFLRGSVTPLVVGDFHSDARGYFVSKQQIAVIPGVAPGSSAELTIKAWIGDSFEASPIKGVWDYASPALGGVVGGNGSYPLPTLTGWGDSPFGAGYALAPGSKPIPTADEVVRQYRQPVSVDVTTLLANDIDPDGGPLTFQGFDESSHEGARITMLGGVLTYRPISDGDDYFNYLVRGLRGGVAVGRVDIRVSDPIGEIAVANQGIAKASGGGTYDMPIWVDADFNGTRSDPEGIAAFADRIGSYGMFALYVHGSAEPVYVTPFQNKAFLRSAPMNLLIPGFRPGEAAPLTIKVWVGENDYEAATLKKTWDFTSLPLGGRVKGETNTLTIPGLTGWGTEDGNGFSFALTNQPVAGADSIRVNAGSYGQISFSELLANDSDPAGGVLRMIGVESATGIASMGAGVVYVFGSYGKETDTFRYAVSSANGAIAYGSVDVAIDPPVPGGGDSTSTGTDTGIGTGTGSTGGDGTTTATSGGSTGSSTGPDTSPGPGGGKIFLVNQMVRRSSGNGTYNVPVWVDANFNGVRDSGEGIGAFASRVFGQPAKLGLFLRNNKSPFATAVFKTNAAGAFLEDPGYWEVSVPGYVPGAIVELTIKAWVGETYHESPVKGSWDFTSPPLGYADYQAPDINGWGDENSSAGFGITAGLKPRVYGHVLTRRLGENVNTSVTQIMQNDSDASGGELTFVSVDSLSREGATVTRVNSAITYGARAADDDTPDYFEYTVRNAQGGIVKGRVDVVVTGVDGTFNTRLAIEHFLDRNEIAFRGVFGSKYVVQSRAGVEGTWQNVGAATHEGNGLFRTADSHAERARLYRVIATH